MSEVIDHVGIRVSDLATSRRMYEAALTEIGYTVLGEGQFEGDAYVLFGRGTSDDFALHALGTAPGRDRVTTGANVAFRAPDTVSVERWHTAAIENGGTGNFAPASSPRVQRPLLRRIRARPGRQQCRSCLPHTRGGRRDPLVAVRHRHALIARMWRNSGSRCQRRLCGRVTACSGAAGSLRRSISRPAWLIASV